MKSVKTKITAIVLCCIIVSSFAIGAVSILNSRRAVLEDSTQIMNLMCENRAENINDLFSSIEQSVNTLTVYTKEQLKDLERFKTDGEYVSQYSDGLKDTAMNAAQNTEGALTVYIRFNPEFTDTQSGVFCGKNRSDGKFKEWAPTDLSLYSPEDMVHVGWFYEPAKNKTGTWLPPYQNENIGVEMISYVIPIYMGETFIGVVGMDIEFRVLQDIVAGTHAYHSGYAFLTDEEALVVYHNELAAGTDLKKYNDGEFSEMALQIAAGENNSSKLLEYTYEGEVKKAAFKDLSNGMRMVLSVPKSEINEQANNLVIQIIIGVFVVIGAAAVFTIMFTRHMVKPFSELTEAAQKIANGDLSISITHQSKDEVGVLAESFRQTVAHLQKYITYINELAYRDLLTGVKNKTAYLEMVQNMEELTRLRRPQYAVVVFDMNDLKIVNDTMGHDFGDIYIINASKIICKVFKRSPVFRIGGDEFVVILENADYTRYAELLEQFEKEIDSYNENPINTMKISVARGIAVYDEETDITYNDVFKRADNAMYHNKAEMKSRKPR